MKCFRCHPKGHYANECLEKKKGKVKWQKQITRNLEIVTDADVLAAAGEGILAAMDTQVVATEKAATST